MNKTTHICLCPSTLVPLLVQGNTSLANDFYRGQEFRDLESRGKHNNIKVTVLTRRSNYTRLVDLLYAFLYKLNIGPVKPIEIVWIEYPTFAAYSTFSNGSNSISTRFLPSGKSGTMILWYFSGVRE